MRGRFLFGAASAIALALAAPGAHAQDADQPGDQSTQTRIDVGGALNGRYEPSQDVDWFRLRVEEGQRYRVTVDAAPAEGENAVDPMVIIYDTTGNQIAYNDDSRGTLNSEVFFVPAQSGDFFLETRPFNEQAIGGYRIAVESSPLPSDDVGNDANSRGRVTPGRAVTGSIEYEGDVDWYRLSARSGTVYRISLNGGEGALGDPLVRVLSRDGEELAFNDDGPNGLNSYLEFSPTSSGDVFIEARAYADAYTGAYTLDVQSARQPQDAVAATTSTRGRVTVGGSVDGVLDFANDTDWYRVRLEEGQTYRFSLVSSGESPVGDPLLRLYDGRGNELAMDDDGGGGLNSLLEYTAASSGNFYLEARGYTPDATGGYTLSARQGDIPADRSTDMSLSAEGDYREGVLSPAGDRDWYRVDLQSGQGLRIGLSSVEGAEALGDPYVVFYGPDGQEVGRDDDSGGNLNAWFEYEAATAGPHYLEVRGFSEDAQGRYAISIAPGEIGADMENAEQMQANLPRLSSITREGDEDWFAIEMIEGRPYRIAAMGIEPGPLPDPYLTLYNSNGEPVISDDDGGLGLAAYLSFTPVTGGVYFVGVSAYEGTGGGRYGVIAMDTEVPGHVYSDEYLDASTGDERVSRIDMPGDLDYYRVDLEEGVRYQIDVRGAGDSPLADPYVALIDADNNRVTADDDSGDGMDARLRFTPSASGSYFIAASGVGGSLGSYQVSITRR